MESDELEAPETGHQTGTDARLDPSSDTPERARRLRRFAAQVDSHSSLLSATSRLRRELPGDEQLGGDYLGVDVNIAARVGAAAKPGQVLVSDALLARIDATDLRTGRSKRLRADGAPRDLHVVRVSRD